MRRTRRRWLFAAPFAWVAAFCASGPFVAPPARAQAWLAQGDRDLREAIERLVDERVLDIPLLAWPMPLEDARSAIATVGRAVESGQRTLTPGQAAAIARIESRLNLVRGEWSLAAGDPSELRGFADAPRERGELGVRLRWRGNGPISGELRARVALDAADGQAARPDGSYLAATTGGWIWTAGFVDRWWGGGQEGSLQLSNNARPVFALALDRGRSQAFETRWLRWLGPWTVGTFFGALEPHRPDINHALQWGARAAPRL